MYPPIHFVMRIERQCCSNMVGSHRRFTLMEGVCQNGASTKMSCTNALKCSIGQMTYAVSEDILTQYFLGLSTSHLMSSSSGRDACAKEIIRLRHQLFLLRRERTETHLPVSQKLDANHSIAPSHKSDYLQAQWISFCCLWHF